LHKHNYFSITIVARVIDITLPMEATDAARGLLTAQSAAIGDAGSGRESI